jgi:hypothetical protein
MSNFSIQYNLSAASIALPFLQSHPAFAQPKWYVRTQSAAA